MSKKSYFLYFLILFIILGIRFFGKQNDYPYKNNEIISNKCVINDIKKEEKKYKLFCNEIVIETYGSEVNIGDKIEYSGKINERVINRYFSEFSLINPDIKVVQKYDKKIVKNWQIYDPVILLKRYSFELRTLFVQEFAREFTGEQGALLSGMILGAKELFSFEFYEQLKESGLVHIVVASGGNIVILISILEKILKNRLSRKMISIVSIIFTLSYLFLASFEAPIIRASIMYFLAVLAKNLGRKTASFYVLIETGIFMMIINPKLIFSLSFWLSMMATFGIILFGNEIDEYFQRKVKRRNIVLDFFRLDFSQTLAAQILVIPIILYSFGKFNLLGILANILVAFLIAPISYGGIIYLGLSFAFQPLASIFSWFMKIILDYFIFVSKVFAEIEIGKIELEFGFIWIFIWYSIVFYFRHKYISKEGI